MSNKQHPASEDAVADERRLAANDARDARDAAATTSALPANPAVAAEPGADAVPAGLSTNPSAAALPKPLVEASPSMAVEAGGMGTRGAISAATLSAASVPVPVPVPVPEPESESVHRAGAQPDSPPDTPLTSATGVGARLARLREVRRWSIEDVSTRLKVPPTKLRSIEAGDLSALPDMTFTLGVIRAYAKLLGVDSAPFAAALRQSSGPIEQDLSMPASRGGGLPRGGKMSTMSWSGPPKRRPWLWAIGAVVLAVVVLLLYRSGTEPAAWLAKLKQNAETANPASAAANASAAEAAAAAASEASGDAPTTGADGQTPEEQSASDTAALAAASNVSAMSASTTTAQTLAAVSAAGPNPVVAASTVKLATAAATAGASAPASAAAASVPSAPPVPAAGQSSIHISVTQDSWVSVRQADGKEVMSGLLHAGDARDAVGTPPLQFVIGNRVGLDSLEVNGAPVDPSKYANAKGNVARFSLP